MESPHQQRVNRTLKKPGKKNYTYIYPHNTLVGSQDEDAIGSPQTFQLPVDRRTSKKSTTTCSTQTDAIHVVVEVVMVMVVVVENAKMRELDKKNSYLGVNVELFCNHVDVEWQILNASQRR